MSEFITIPFELRSISDDFGTFDDSSVLIGVFMVGGLNSEHFLEVDGPLTQYNISEVFLMFWA